MVWQARNSDNSPRTPSAYVRHDKDNNVVAGGLLGRNAYDRHDKDNVDVTNPGSTLRTDDYGNQYYDWNADYVNRNISNIEVGAVLTLTVAAPGSGYSSATGVVTTTLTGTGDGLTVDTTAAGTISAAAVNNGGFGYAVGDTVSVPGGDGAGVLTVATIS